jgi:hypothetical protein
MKSSNPPAYCTNAGIPPTATMAETWPVPVRLTVKRLGAVGASVAEKELEGCPSYDTVTSAVVPLMT